MFEIHNRFNRQNSECLMRPDEDEGSCSCQSEEARTDTETMTRRVARGRLARSLPGLVSSSLSLSVSHARVKPQTRITHTHTDHTDEQMVKAKNRPEVKPLSMKEKVTLLC